MVSICLFDAWFRNPSSRGGISFILVLNCDSAPLLSLNLTCQIQLKPRFMDFNFVVAHVKDLKLPKYFKCTLHALKQFWIFSLRKYYVWLWLCSDRFWEWLNYPFISNSKCNETRRFCFPCRFSCPETEILITPTLSSSFQSSPENWRLRIIYSLIVLYPVTDVGW